MSDTEELITRLRAVVETALSDASAASSEFDCSASDHAATEAHCRELGAVRDELIEALEKVTAERDVLSSLREQMSLRLRYVEGKREQAEAERDQLAAVVQQLRWLTAGSDWNGGQVDDILHASPPAALDRVKAEALREAADAFEGGTINVEIFSTSSEKRYWQGANEARRNLVASMRERADRIEKGESNE